MTASACVRQQNDERSYRRQAVCQQSEDSPASHVHVEATVEPTSRTRSLAWAVAASLIVHAMVLFFPRKEPAARPTASSRFDATLSPGPREEAQPTPPRPPRMAATAAKAAATRPTAKPPPRAPVMTVPKPAGPAVADTPRESVAEKEGMKRFLDELAVEAKAAPKPSLAQRSLAMARDMSRQQARQDAEGSAMLERRPNTPPPEPFSLDLYLDGLLKRLNRSAAFVRNDPRSTGLRTASVQFRINPDGSLKSFTVRNAGDQQEEIAFIKSVVERAIPFAAFPPDLDRAARSLGVTICIHPGRGDGGGFGFTRMGEGRAC